MSILRHLHEAFRFERHTAEIGDLNRCVLHTILGALRRRVPGASMFSLVRSPSGSVIQLETR